MDALQFLFPLLKGYLNQEAIDDSLFKEFSVSDWDRLFQCACKHNVVPLIFDAFDFLPREVQPPLSNRMKWMGETAAAEDNLDAVVGALSGLLEFFNKRGFRTMVLKGLSIARYYPQPNHRVSSDIDLYMFDDRDEADSALIKEFGIDIQGSDHGHHSNFTFEGVSIENHCDFLAHRTFGGNKECNALLKELIEKECEEGVFRGNRIFTATPTFNAIYLIRHQQVHFTGEPFSLRQLCDWFFFLRQEHDNIDWDYVTKVYERFKMTRFVDVINSIMVSKFGLPEDWIPSFSASEADVNRVLQDLEDGLSYIDPAMPRLKRLGRYWKYNWKYKLAFNCSSLTAIADSIMTTISNSED